ncbi:hypothetical protein QTO34_019319 [Cnephaeus nilssonii]|uniref:BZIP domain-containing protein n=1 Tax=Cnephaeus nilssonii TaxID=3371016 RepID=A0AA40HWH2_CNENI|nr:hypothetical protein QTO34_019319 [Eptesicus nilssonii]
MTAGSLPELGPLTELPILALTAEEPKYSDIHSINIFLCKLAIIVPLHFLEVKLCKRPQPVKSELDKEEEQRKRRWEKNKVVATPCRYKEWKEFLQMESEWLDLMNAELKTQMEELKQEWQKLILMLNRHHPPALSGPTVLRLPTQKATHCWSSWRRSWRRAQCQALLYISTMVLPGVAAGEHPAGPAGVAVGMRHGCPCKAHTH